MLTKSETLRRLCGKQVQTTFRVYQEEVHQNWWLEEDHLCRFKKTGQTTAADDLFTQLSRHFFMNENNKKKFSWALASRQMAIGPQTVSCLSHTAHTWLEKSCNFIIGWSTFWPVFNIASKWVAWKMLKSREKNGSPWTSWTGSCSSPPDPRSFCYAFRVTRWFFWMLWKWQDGISNLARKLAGFFFSSLAVKMA